MKNFVVVCTWCVAILGAAMLAPAPAGAQQPSPSAAPSMTTSPTPATPRSSRAAAAKRAPNQFATEAEAKSHCSTDTVVWVNLSSKIYHFSNNKNYGKTKRGAYMCRHDSDSAGFHAAKGEKAP